MTELRGAAERRTRGGQGLDTEFRVAAKRRTRGGQGPATEPSHRVDGQEEDKRRTQSPATERRTRPSHRAKPQS